MARLTGAIRHTHKYLRRPDGMWACAGLDGCTHYMPKNMAPAPAGHKSICWGCEKEFDLYPWNMDRKDPMCDECVEKLNMTSKWLDGKEKEIEPNPDGLDAFRTPEALAKDRAKRRAAKQALKDEIEITEPDDIG